ncbi:ferritin [Sediminitomix flava]|uniref:Ferritin n=1 Tax=Sediminitomix flava TaxID=379075 RepID=A0A315Z945_SEDFL|nr:ferritin [Sediminitomix flava]PWJ40230.1 ferritin [Sediminitomix flava]
MNNTRLKSSLSNLVEESLNKQVELEDLSSQFYLSCASWCEIQGYQNAAKFLYEHAEEERMHMLKIFKYINAVGGHALAAEIKDIQTSFSSLREIFDQLLEHEIKVTKSINHLVDLCFQEKDWGTFQFLEWFVAEQREEEETARRIIEVFELIGEDHPQGKWLIDQELGKMVEGGGSSAEV